MTPDERADLLAEIACGLAVRVRDDDPASVHRWLKHSLAELGGAEQDWIGLCMVLAAAVPIEISWSALTAWTRKPGGPDTVAAVLERRKVLNEALRSKPVAHAS